MGRNNVMRWDCSVRGCFNQKKRVKLGELADALPRRISFSDLDAVVEIGGRFLVLEWKGPGAPLPTGQRIMFDAMSRAGITVGVVEGDAETMAVEAVVWREGGRVSDRIATDLQGLKGAIRRWVDGRPLLPGGPPADVRGLT